MPMLRPLLVLCLLAAWLAPADAADLRIGQAAAATSVDPHFYNASPNNSLAMHLFDRLTERAPDGGLKPGLAVSWSMVGETVWEFKLRPGVKFQDGSDLTAEDVVFSLARAANVPNSPGGFAGLVRAIERAEIIDPTTIRLHTAAPAPNLPGDLSDIAILSRRIAGNATTEDYNSGKAAIGSGPYKLVRYAPGDRVELIRNDAWWGGKPEWDRVSIRFIANSTARVAALLAGDVDIIDVPPTSDLSRLKADVRLSVYNTDSQRMIYLQPDFSRIAEPAFITDLAGNRLGWNPMRDVRVRRALSLAINREALTNRVMERTASPTGQWLTSGMFGFNRDVPTPPFDLNLAKSLLIEAGFPLGFRITLHTPNDRYPNDSATAQAIAQMWSRVGVQTEVQALPWSIYTARGSHQEWSIGLWGWGSNTAEAGNALINVLGTYDPAHGRGASNQGRYANPALDALTDRALATIDDGSREDLLRQAVAMAMDDVAIIPLFQLVNYWAVRKDLFYEARGDERTIAMNAHRIK